MILFIIYVVVLIFTSGYAYNCGLGDGLEIAGDIIEEYAKTKKKQEDEGAK